MRRKKVPNIETPTEDQFQAIANSANSIAENMRKRRSYLDSTEISKELDVVTRLELQALQVELSGVRGIAQVRGEMREVAPTQDEVDAAILALSGGSVKCLDCEQDQENLEIAGS